LDELKDAISRFHMFRKVFAPIRGTKGFSLPRQHAIAHYPELIRSFAAPNGVCTSITESKHIRAVKEPWRRSNRNNALFQMLTTNQRLDQLSAARDVFTKRGMLNGTLLESVLLRGMYYFIQYHSMCIFTILSLDLQSDDDEDKHDSEQESLLTELPYGNGESEAAIADEDIQAGVTDEDIQAGITDDVLAQVKFPERSRESTSHLQLPEDAKCSTVRQ
jgi:hypothetical protein